MTSVTTTGDIACVVRGAVADEDVQYARTRVYALLDSAPAPVLFARIKLTALTAPALPRPAVAQATLDLDGRLIRAQTARPTMREAVDELHDRLRTRLRRAAGNWEAIRGRRPLVEEHEWRHAGLPTKRPPYTVRPDEERQLVRRKSVALARMTVDEAVLDMLLLDYRFHLFVESTSNVDSVVYRTDDGLHLAQTQPAADVTAAGVRVRLSPHDAPALTVPEAITRLTATGWLFVFFRDSDTGRGAVVYHRFDGHYGLISPAAIEMSVIRLS